MNQKVPTQYFNLDKVQYHSREPKKRRSKFQKYVEEQKPDYHHEQLQKAMKRINQYNYSWDSAPDDPIGSKTEKTNIVNLSNLLDEVRQSD